MKTINEQYVIDEDIATREGGMADVLCAYDSKHGMRRVAIKLFRDGLIGISYVLEAFSRECASLAELNAHPNTVRLLDHGTDHASGRKYIALDWVDGTLADHLKKHPVAGWDDWYERYGKGILDALSFAYSRDIIHRDIKPQNILLDESNVVRVRSRDQMMKVASDSCANVSDLMLHFRGQG